MSPRTVSEIVESEVWVVSPTTPSEVYCDGEFVAAVRTMEQLSPTMTQWRGDRERAQLVQCAPEALRILRKLIGCLEGGQAVDGATLIAAWDVLGKAGLQR